MRSLENALAGLFIALLLVTSSSPATALAQASYVTGTVTDEASGNPLSSVRVELRNQSGSPAGNAITNEAGQYRINNVQPGNYSLYFARIGFAPATIADISVAAGIPVIRGVQLRRAALQLSQQVITVTRTAESQQQAPASVHVVSQQAIEERPSLTVADHMKSVPGVDVSAGGIVQSNIVARGFNNAFSGSMLQMVDYRFASVPSLRVNVPALFTTTNNDIERVETVLGPAAALYGPNSANGVLAIFTRSPFESRGTTLSVEAGDRGILKGGLRTALVVAEQVGIKISAEKMIGNDFRYADPDEPAEVLRPPTAGAPRVLTPITRDFSVERTSGEARIDYRYGNDTEIVASYGMAHFGSGIEITGASGAAQARDWTYNHAQLRVQHKGTFAQVFTNFSDAGNTDSLDNSGTFLLRSGNPIVDHSKVVAFQLQQKWDATERLQFIFGADYIKTTPDTKGTINGRNENSDNVTEYGFYAHSLTRLTDKFDLVAALRMDHQSLIDENSLAPRVGIVYKRSETENIRLTYNRAQFTPANFSFFLDFTLQPLSPTAPQGPYFVRALGNNGGFTYRRDCADGFLGLCMKSPFNLTPTQDVNAGGADLYRAGIAVVQTPIQQLLALRGRTPAQIGATMQLLFSQAPNNTQLGTYLRTAIPGQGLVPLTTGVSDIAALEQELYDVVELGYKKIFGEKGRLAADFWYQRRKNFTSPAMSISPNPFVNPTALGGFLVPVLTPDLGATLAAEVADSIARRLAAVPLGTVTPNHPLATTHNVLFSYVQVQEALDIFGSDIAAEWMLNDKLWLAGTYSWVSESFFPEVFETGVEPLSLNAPDNKATLTIGYRDTGGGVSAEVRGRYTNAFKVSSGVYQGEVPVNAFMDIGATYRLPNRSNILLSVSVTNVLDNERPTFVGVPALGRLAMARLQVGF